MTWQDRNWGTGESSVLLTGEPSIDNLIRLIYILKENNLQNIYLIFETNPLRVFPVLAEKGKLKLNGGFSATLKNETLQ